MARDSHKRRLVHPLNIWGYQLDEQQNKRSLRSFQLSGDQQWASSHIVLEHVWRHLINLIYCFHLWQVVAWGRKLQPPGTTFKMLKDFGCQTWVLAEDEVDLDQSDLDRCGISAWNLWCLGKWVESMRAVFLWHASSRYPDCARFFTGRILYLRFRCHFLWHHDGEILSILWFWASLGYVASILRVVGEMNGIWGATLSDYVAVLENVPSMKGEEKVEDILKEAGGKNWWHDHDQTALTFFSGFL